MKKALFLFLALVGVFCLGYAGFLLVQVAQQPASLLCGEPVHDFGKLHWQDADRSHVFQVVSGFDKPVKITRALTTCGCMVVAYPTGEIQPGERIRLEVKTSWTGLSGRQSSAIVVYNSEASEPLTLRIHGSIDKRGGLSPAALDFGEVPSGATRERIVHLVSRPDETFDGPGEALCDSKYLRVQPASVANDSRTAAWKVALHPGKPCGFREELVHFTPPGATQSLTLPVRFKVVPTIDAAPTSVFFGFLSGTDTATATIRLSGLTREHWDVHWERVPVGRAPFAFRVIPDNHNPNQSVVEVRASGKEVRPGKNAHQLVVTSGSEQIKIPVEAIGTNGN